MIKNRPSLLKCASEMEEMISEKKDFAEGSAAGSNTKEEEDMKRDMDGEHDNNEIISVIET